LAWVKGVIAVTGQGVGNDADDAYFYEQTFSALKERLISRAEVVAVNGGEADR
jgi:hypothetical protein